MYPPGSIHSLFFEHRTCLEDGPQKSDGLWNPVRANLQSRGMAIQPRTSLEKTFQSLYGSVEPKFPSFAQAIRSDHTSAATRPDPPQPPAAMNEPDEEKPSRGGAVVLTVLLAPALYVLSLGPAVLLARSLPSARHVLSPVYAPLEWLYHSAPVIRKPLDRYIRLWRAP